MQRKIKSKKIKNALNMIASVYSRRCESYKMYLKRDSPHQAIMIVCESKWFSHISNRHNMHTLMQFAMFFTHNTQYSLLFWIIGVIIGLIHCGYGLCLVQTHNSWMFLKLCFFLYIVDVFQYIM